MAAEVVRLCVVREEDSLQQAPSATLSATLPVCIYPMCVYFVAIHY